MNDFYAKSRDTSAADENGRPDADGLVPEAPHSGSPNDSPNGSSQTAPNGLSNGSTHGSTHGSTVSLPNLGGGLNGGLNGSLNAGLHATLPNGFPRNSLPNNNPHGLGKLGTGLGTGFHHDLRSSVGSANTPVNPGVAPLNPTTNGASSPVNPHGFHPDLLPAPPSLESQSNPQSNSQSSPQSNPQSPSASASQPSTVSQSKLTKFKAAMHRLDPRHLRRDHLHPRNLKHLPLPKNWKSWALIVLGVGAAGTAIAVRQVIVSIEKDLPETKDVLVYVRSGSLTIKANDGTVLQQQGPVTREQVTLSAMPKLLPEAFIASEDQDFYQHTGVDYQAIVRATIANLFAGEVREGGSTITQQLSRIAFLDQERSLTRKLREALLAQKMERELTKNQILERYLNLVYLGSGAYGVADAAWIYFSKPAEELTLSEAAMIAGMAPAPSVYSPLVNPQLAKQRRDIVLRRMERAGFITNGEMQQAIATPIETKANAPKHMESTSPYFTSFIEKELPKYVPKEELEAGGLTVETTLDLKMQQQAEEEVKDAIANYGYGQAFEQAALVSIDPRTGEIKALVGGDDFMKSQFNRATQAQRQPGSTFKTFVYATAIAAGFSPYKSYIDAKYVVDGYEPRNYGKNYRGSVSMQTALGSSINIVAVKVLVDVGFEPTIEMAKRMGIKSDLLPAYALALGASEVNLLELTSAYGTLANKGNHMEVHGITRIVNRFGRVIYTANFKPQRALDADSAAIVTWMLEGVVRGGTGGNASLPDRAVAGKTGTSEKRRDLWFIGYIPQLVTGVWMGNDDSSPTWGASSTAAAVWGDFMYKATEGMEVEEFPELPENLDDREGTIKAKPVQPGRVDASSSAGPSESSEEGDGQNYWSDPAVEGGGGSYYEEPSGGGGGGSYEGNGETYSEPEPTYSGGGGGGESAPAEPAPAPAAESAPPPAAEPAPAPAAESAPPPISAPPPAPIPEPIQAPPSMTTP